MGPHLKNTVALAAGSQAFLSQHVGDLDTGPARAAHRRVADDLQQLFEAPAATLVCDAHPDYASTREAEARGLPLVRIQHHLAHVLGCIAENEISGPVLGVSWDGTGYGEDRSVWGGEFLRVDGAHWQRRAHLRTFALPGGEAAVREPRRSALGVLWEILGADALDMEELPAIGAFAPGDRQLLGAALRRGVNTPRTSSAGRLFDAVASLCDLHQRVRFEGQAAMELEFRAGDPGSADAPYPMELRCAGAGCAILDWEPLIRCVLDDHRRGSEVAAIARSFHEGLVAGIVAVAREVAEERVVLTGGCFQNRFLLEACVRNLTEAGFRPYWHQRVPPNDGGIALGQIVAALSGIELRSQDTPDSPRSTP
jgi:hydrogenase maturation protein HypF